MPAPSRRRLLVTGTVQGVGFRPFVYRLATELALAGWVANRAGEVLIEVEGSSAVLECFAARLLTEAPPLARIGGIESSALPADGGSGFAIAASDAGPGATAVAPDGDVCADCRRELFDPADRRYRYPFITCTNCGPRYSIVTGLPYDRPRTTMAGFPLCAACAREYADPADRRFHAQPLACPACGPRLRLLDATGTELAEEPLAGAIARLRRGEIGAIKGLSGYHLAVDPHDCAAVARLRQRKRREEKPFALLAADLATVRRQVACDELAARLLESPEKPIVLLRRLAESSVAANVAPGNDWLGCMLPATPLHLLLAESLPLLVLTSANPSDEPLVSGEDEALQRLAGIADFFLVHDRPIRTPLDDSLVRLLAGEPVLLRRSRGFVPRAIALPVELPPVLAVGAELKGTVCLAAGREAIVSRHLGDMGNPAVLESLRRTVTELTELFAIRPQLVAHDLHPDFLATRWAEEESGLPTLAVQHHHAHLAACLAENGESGPAIGVIFDGSGLGPDGSIWGGEFLVGDLRDSVRRGHLRQVPLPGGDAAARAPWRMALSWLAASHGDIAWELALPSHGALPTADQALFRQLLDKGVNAPLTSSCGRLFDAAASLLGLRQQVSYEGQAALELEGLAERGTPSAPTAWELQPGADGTLSLDPTPFLRRLVQGMQRGEPPADLALAFHLSLADAVAALCRSLGEETGLRLVALSGGCFQNRLLTELLAERLTENGFRVLRHRLLPPNDGGLSLGQAVCAGLRAAELER